MAEDRRWLTRRMCAARSRSCRRVCVVPRNTSISPDDASRTCRTSGSVPAGAGGSATGLELARAAILPTMPPSVVAATPAAPAPAATRSMERRDGAARPALACTSPVVASLAAAAVAATTVSSSSGIAIPFDRGAAALPRACGRSTRQSRLMDRSHAGRSCHGAERIGRKVQIGRTGLADWPSSWIGERELRAAFSRRWAGSAARQTRRGITRMGVVVGRLVPPAGSTVMPS